MMPANKVFGSEQPMPTPLYTVALRVLLIGLIIGVAAYGWTRPKGITLDRYLGELSAAQHRGGYLYTAMVGDSITAGSPQLLVCGKPVVKAAFDGARVAELVAHVVPSLRTKPPSAILLAAGINDAWRHIATPKGQRLVDFRNAYHALISATKALTPTVGIVLIPPVSRQGELGANFFDPALIAELNGIIASLATELQVPTVSLDTLAGADGLALEGMTLDGVHPSPAGYAIWAATVFQAWTRLTSCG
jgi:lysophospholipase L1-like esterase